MPRSQHIIRSRLSHRPTVPVNASFATLELRRRSGNVVSFDHDVFLNAWIACGYRADFLNDTERGEMFEFIARWYAEYVRSGGTASAEWDQLINFLLSAGASSVRILPLRS